MWFGKQAEVAPIRTLEHQLEEIMDTLEEHTEKLKSLQDEISSISLWAGMNDYEYTEPDK